MNLMSIQTSGVIVSFSFYICVMGFDSWWGGVERDLEILSA